MNIMIISNNPKRTSSELAVLYKGQLSNQHYLPPVILTETESAISPLFDLGLQTDPDRHTIIITDNPNKLWRGMREELLDMIIEIKNEEAEKWLVNLLGRGFR